MSRRVRLGDWTCPSGNNVEAFLRPISDGLAMIDMEWDAPPPLLPADDSYYRRVVRPAVTRLVAEYTERTGRALVVEL